VVPAIQADRVRGSLRAATGSKVMKLLNWLGVALLATALSAQAATPDEPANPKLRSVYQRVHFSQQYPPEAAQFIQAKLQDAEDPLPVLADLAGDQRPEVRILVAMLIGEFGRCRRRQIPGTYPG